VKKINPHVTSAKTARINEDENESLALFAVALSLAWRSVASNCSATTLA
jgi:hypothetical protein